MARLARPPAILKKWEEYLPQHLRFASSRVLPAVRRGALEIEAISTPTPALSNQQTAQPLPTRIAAFFRAPRRIRNLSEQG